MGWAGNYQKDQTVCVFSGNPPGWKTGTVIQVLDTMHNQQVSVSTGGGPAWITASHLIRHGACPQPAPGPSPAEVRVEGAAVTILDANVAKVFRNGVVELDLTLGGAHVGRLRLDMRQIDDL